MMHCTTLMKKKTSANGSHIWSFKNYLVLLKIHCDTHYTFCKVCCVFFSKSKGSFGATSPRPVIGIENGDISSRVTNLMECPSLSKPVYSNTVVPTPTFSATSLKTCLNAGGEQVGFADSPVLTIQRK